MASNHLTAGTAEAEIAVGVGRTDPGVALGASPDPGAPRMAKVLVLSDGARTLALVTLDLMGLRRDDAELLSTAIGERIGLDPAAIMLICSHAHSAPASVLAVGEVGLLDHERRNMADCVADLAREAHGSLQDAALGLGQAMLPHLIYNHRLMTRNMKAVSAWLGVPKDEVLASEGPIDPAFAVLVVRDGRGFPLCLLWNFAADNRFVTGDGISADLPRLVQAEIDSRLGRHVPVLCLTGCGGNARYNHGLNQTVDAVASAVMAVQLETSCDPGVSLGFAREAMILPIREYGWFRSKADIELKCPEALAGYEREVALLREEGAHAVPTSVQAFRLGRVGLAGLPGLPFVEFALQIKAQSPFSHTLVVGSVHDYPGYVLPRQAFEHEGFESWPARSNRLGPGSGEFMAERVVQALYRLKDTARRLQS